MTIHPAKASEYASVNAESVAQYIKSYSANIEAMIHNKDSKSLSECNKAQLNAIAAELETVRKRMRWILDGKY